MPLGATPGLKGKMVRTQEVSLVASDTSPADLVQDSAADNHEKGEQPVDRAKDRRKTERLFAYWQRLRDSRPFPAPEEIECDQIGGLWPYCFLLPVQNIDNLGFSYLGCRISGGQGVAAPQANAGPKEVARVFDSVRILSKEVRDRAVPARDSGAFDNRWGDEIKYRTIMLPVGETPPTVDHIFGLVSYLEIQRAEIPGLKISTPLDR